MSSETKLNNTNPKEDNLFLYMNRGQREYIDRHKGTKSRAQFVKNLINELIKEESYNEDREKN